MFERFTADARSVVVGAQEVARATNSTRIDSVHLLLSLSAQDTGIGPQALRGCGVGQAEIRAASGTPGDGLDREALASLGIDLDAVSNQADAVFGTGALHRAGPGTRGSKGMKHIPFTAEAKKTLEISLRESIRLADRSITSAHLLLAFLRLTDSSAGKALHKALAKAGSSADTLRETIDRLRRGDGGTAGNIPVAV